MNINTPSVASRPTPHIDILFLGSPGVGKATFLSRLPSVVHPSVSRRKAAGISQAQAQSRPSNEPQPQLSSPSTTTPPPPAEADTQPPPYASTASLSSTPQPSSNSITPSVPAPLEGSVSFSVLLFSRPYNISIHPSTTALFTDPFPPTASFAIIAFDISDRVSLWNARYYWSVKLKEHYPDEEAMRVMLLGLKRDLRSDRKVRKRNWEDGKSGVGGGSAEIGGAKAVRVVDRAMPMGARETSNLPAISFVQSGDADWEYECVMPEEGLQAAREMRADRYAECSALTGELMWEVVEDITRMAAKTTVEETRDSAFSCMIM